jgi:hypothetical protein
MRVANEECRGRSVTVHGCELRVTGTGVRPYQRNTSYRRLRVCTNWRAAR